MKEKTGRQLIRSIRKTRGGVTLVELLVTISILALLGTVVMPLANMTGKRVREIELRRNLRILRTAIDDYKSAYDAAVEGKKITATANRTGYPKNLEILVQGDDFGGAIPNKRRFLRRIPRDPMNPADEAEGAQWGLRSYADSPDSYVWGREDVFDVYSESQERAIDGTLYRNW